MRIFIDTEFTQFSNQQLISIGLFSQNEKTFYAETPFDFNLCSDFVKETVLPLLSHDKGVSISFAELRTRLKLWLTQFHTDGQEIKICFDYSRDWTLFGSVLDNEIPSWIEGVNIYKYLDKSIQDQFFSETTFPRHHALSDAMSNCVAFNLEKAEKMNWLKKRKSNKRRSA